MKNFGYGIKEYKIQKNNNKTKKQPPNPTPNIAFPFSFESNLLMKFFCHEFD